MMLEQLGDHPYQETDEYKDHLKLINDLRTEDARLTEELTYRKSLRGEVKELNKAVKSRDEKIEELESENDTMLEVIDFVLNEKDPVVGIKALKVALGRE